jgi:hypothetical protein
LSGREDSRHSRKARPLSGLPLSGLSGSPFRPVRCRAAGATCPEALRPGGLFLSEPPQSGVARNTACHRKNGWRAVPKPSVPAAASWSAVASGIPRDTAFPGFAIAGRSVPCRVSATPFTRLTATKRLSPSGTAPPRSFPILPASVTRSRPSRPQPAPDRKPCASGLGITDAASASASGLPEPRQRR